MGSSCSDVYCSVAARHQVLTAFLYLLVEVEYTAVVLTQLLDCLRRYEAAAYKLLHRTLGNPLRILHVTLATRELGLARFSLKCGDSTRHIGIQ